MEVAKEKALRLPDLIVEVEKFEYIEFPVTVREPARVVVEICPTVKTSLTVRFTVEREENPVAAPADVILHVPESTETLLDSLPKVTLPEAERLPPVDIPEEKSPNEAETPEPC